MTLYFSLTKDWALIYYLGWLLWSSFYSVSQINPVAVVFFLPLVGEIFFYIILLIFFYGLHELFTQYCDSLLLTFYCPNMTHFNGSNMLLPVNTPVSFTICVYFRLALNAVPHFHFCLILSLWIPQTYHFKCGPHLASKF